jgi:cell division protein FtsB
MSSPVVQPRSRMPRIAEAAVERARLTVVPRRRTRASRMPFVMLVSLVLLGGVVGLLLFNTSMQQASFAAASLEEQASTLSARQQTLEMQLDEMRDPQRVAEQAQRMGMVPAGSPAFLRLDGKVLGEAAPATADDRLRLNPRPPGLPAVLNPAPIVTTVVGDRDGAREGSLRGDQSRGDRAVGRGDAGGRR